MSSKYYAVKVGRETGIFRTWDQCKQQVHGYSGAVFKSFKTLNEAKQFTGQSAEHRFCNRQSKIKSHAAPYKTYKKQHRSVCTEQQQTPVVYSDGCCFNNGQSGARAGVGVFWQDESVWNISEKLHGNQTNQRAELISACRAIETAIAQNYNTLELRTDSVYTIKAMTEWVDKWERNDWKTSQGMDVKNQKDIIRLRDLTKQVNVKWTHVPGHNGIHGNEMADQLAKAGSKK